MGVVLGWPMMPYPILVFGYSVVWAGILLAMDPWY